MKILLVEDEIELQSLIQKGLQLSGYVVDVCNDGLKALDMMDENQYELLILDLNIPSLDGLDVLRTIRRSNLDIKVLILSARSNIDDKVQGLDEGANDYLGKPFNFAELEARIRNLLRRHFIQKPSLINYGNLMVDTNSHTVKYHEEILNFTHKEYAILIYLLNNQDRIISAEELLEHAWDIHVDSFNQSLRVHISTLRKKLRIGTDFDPIETVISKGYIIRSNDV